MFVIKNLIGNFKYYSKIATIKMSEPTQLKLELREQPYVGQSLFFRNKPIHENGPTNQDLTEQRPTTHYSLFDFFPLDCLLNSYSETDSWSRALYLTARQILSEVEHSTLDRLEVRVHNLISG